MTIVNTPASTGSRTLRYLPGLCLASLLLLAASGALAQPDAATSVPAVDAPDAPSGTEGTPTFSYRWLTGSTFHPVSTPGPFAYSTAGCIQPSGTGTRTFHHKLLLPQGSLVKYVRLYYRNTSTANTPTAYFTTYNMVGGITDHSFVAGSNIGGYGSALSGEMNYTVDHTAEPINIDVSLGSVTDGSVQFCGVRVAYYAPELEIDIFKDGFE